MSYTKTVWEDLPSTDTPLNATNLNNIEDGIENIDQEVEGVSQSLGVDTNTYDNTATYSVGDTVIYENKIYECNTAISTAEEFDSSKWDLVPVIDNMKINNKLLNSTIVDTANTNLNDYTTDGVYYFSVDYAPTNRPVGSNGWLEVFTGEQGVDSPVKQIWYRHGTPNTNDWDTYERTYSSWWSDWKKYVDTNSLNIQRASNNSNTFTIRIPHGGTNNINSAIVFSFGCCYVVSIGGSTELWTYSLGNRNNVTMTASIATHTNSYVDVTLTFSGTMYGGISVIGLGNYV